MKSRGLIRSTLRVVPAFTVLAILGCLVGRFVFHIPLENLGVAVSVPSVLLFFSSRILTLIVPSTVPDEPMSGNFVESFFAAIAAFFTVATIALTLSAPIYRMIDLSSLFWPSLHMAGWALFSALLALCAILLISASKNFGLWLSRTIGIQRRVFWEALGLPTSLVIFIITQFNTQNHVRHQ